MYPLDAIRADHERIRRHVRDIDQERRPARRSALIARLIVDYEMHMAMVEALERVVGSDGDDESRATAAVPTFLRHEHRETSSLARLDRLNSGERAAIAYSIAAARNAVRNSLYRSEDS
jgi:hypothetical protein